jgi:Na+-transporting methylmalonyl-CoA/oxaloacetate decarboxylase gamma subunit
MKMLKRITPILALALAMLSVHAQQVTDLRLNEILIKNDSNYQDEYGRCVAWIEVYNTAYNIVNVGGCFLTNDTTGFYKGKESLQALKELKSKWYGIPTSDPTTTMVQRSHVVFFLDGMASYGTYHTNFTPENSNYVALISSNGKEIIDILEFPEELRAKAVSYGCAVDGDVATRQILDNYTPGSANQVSSGETKADRLKETDPHGLSMTIISMAIVFSVLTIIYCMLKIFGYTAKKRAAKNAVKKDVPAPAVANVAPTIESKDGLSEEEIVAIGMALHLHFGAQHDQESEVLTIAPNASAWANKSLNFTPSPRKN